MSGCESCRVCQMMGTSDWYRWPELGPCIDCKHLACDKSDWLRKYSKVEAPPEHVSSEAFF